MREQARASGDGRRESDTADSDAALALTKMEHEKALQELNKFLLLAKTTKGAATAALIKQATEHPHVFVFGELLALPNVQELEGSPSASALELLKLFAYGTWREFRASPLAASAPLSDAQATKLKKLTVVSIASQSKKLSYDVLQREVEMHSVREVEDLLIECMYGGLLQGRLDQAAKTIDVFSCAPRDVHPDELEGMSETLLQWHSSAVGLMASVNEQLSRFKTHAEEARAAQTELDAKVEAVKVAMRSNTEGGGEGGFGLMGDSDARMDFDDEKMRKSGRLKAGRGAAPPSTRRPTG